MKAKKVLKIFNELTEEATKINERARAKGQESDVIYSITINTANRQYEYDMAEDSNWDIEDDTLWLETNKGTQWIDCDKIESIEI